MRLYALYQGRFVEGWIPDEHFNMRVLPRLFDGRRPVGDKRTLSRRLFGSELFPDLPDLAYFINGQWFTNDYQMIGSDELLDYVFAHTDEIYLKLENTGRGNGVSRVRRSGFGRAIQSITHNSVIQRPVVQHDWFDKIYPRAVATLRITTSYLDSSGPRFRASYLRIGYAGRTYVEADRSLRCAVTDGQGSLAAEALDETWRPHSRHQDSGFVFQDSRIPLFSKALDTCLQLHTVMPHDQIVGWDVGITKAGNIEIMEWNSGHTDIKFSETTVGPIFADCDFERFGRCE